MKTIRLVGQGCPVRVSDAAAKRIVEKDLDGEYCPKSVYKEWTKKPAYREYLRLPPL